MVFHRDRPGWTFLTFVFIFDGEAEDVPRPESRAVVHTAVKQRMGIRILDVEDFPSGGDVTGDALIRRDTKLLLLRRDTDRQISTL